MFDGVPLFPVEDPGHMLTDGASGMGVEVGDGVPVLCLEAVQDCLEDGVRVVGEAPLGGAHRVDGTTPRVFQDAADVLQGLVRRVASAVSFAFLGCGRYAVGVPFLELVAAGGEERAEVGVLVSCFRLLGRSRVASSAFVVQMSLMSCWRVRSRGAPVWLVSRSMPHACAARRMALVNDGASGRRRMACRALLYLCLAPWSFLARNRSVVGRVSSGRVGDDGVDVEGSVARARGREVPVGFLVDAYCGWVRVARVDAGGPGAGLVGLMGGCAGEPCCEVGEAQLVPGVPEGYVGGCGWAGAVDVRAGSVQVAYDDGGCQEGDAAVRQAQGVQEVLGLFPDWDVRE